jgi:hypothetical protein
MPSKDVHVASLTGGIKSFPRGRLLTDPLSIFQSLLTVTMVKVFISGMSIILCSRICPLVFSFCRTPPESGINPPIYQVRSYPEHLSETLFRGQDHVSLPDKLLYSAKETEYLRRMTEFVSSLIYSFSACSLFSILCSLFRYLAQ